MKAKFVEPIFENGRPIRDSLGRLFDPARFKPALDKLKRFVNARAGRKPAKKARQLPLVMSSDSTVSAPATETPAPAPAAASTETTPPAASSNAESGAAGSPPADPAPNFDDIERAAGPKTASPAASGASSEGGEGDDGLAPMTTAESIIGIIQTALVLIGDEEGVLSKAERLALRPPLERVLKKYNIGADILPAEVDLALALALIVVARLQKPKTATWFARVKIWFGAKVTEHKGRQLAAAVREANS